MKVLILTMLLAPGFAFGDIFISTVSYHINRDNIDGERINETNPGIFYSEKFTLGVYKNTMNRASVLLAKNVSLTNDFSLSLGFATGYKPSPIVPMIGLNYDIGRLRITLAPDFRVKTKKTSMVFLISFKVG